MLHEVRAGMLPPATLTPEQVELMEACDEYEKIHFADCLWLKREQHVTLVDDTFEVVTAGTMDLVGKTADGMLKVLDYKFGRKWVSPNGFQLRAYSAAAMQTWDADRVEAHIFQPRAGGGKPIMFTNFRELFDEVKNVVERAHDPHAPLVPGEHCHFCPARPDCTAAANVETALTVSTASLMANPQKLGQAAYIAREVKSRCDQILAMCKDATLAGEPTGWRILEKKGKAAITDAKVALDRLQPYISQEEYISLLAVPYGKLKGAIAAKLKTAHGLSVKQSEERLAEMLGDVLQRGEPTKVIVEEKKGDN